MTLVRSILQQVFIGLFDGLKSIINPRGGNSWLYGSQGFDFFGIGKFSWGILIMTIVLRAYILRPWINQELEGVVWI